MSNTQQNKDATYYEDLSGVAAFGHLSTEEQNEFDDYLLNHEGARTEFAELMAMVGLLPLALDEVSPSAGLRDRIAAAVEADLARNPIQSKLQYPKAIESPDVPSNMSWITSRTGKALSAAAAIVLVAVAAITITMNLRTTPSEDIDFATFPNGLNGSLIYQPDDDLFVFESGNMPPAPENSVYQVWLIPAGGNPESVGLMDGTKFEVERDRDKYAAFAITVEPGPNGSAGPTTDPIVVAPLQT